MTTPTFDNGIPELTEVIASDAVPNIAKSLNTAAAPSKPASPVNAPTPASKINNETAQTHAAAHWQDAEWRQLEAEIKERITHQVLTRIDFVLEQRVRDTLADVLQTAVEGVANEIKQGLRVTLEDVIARAITQEITKLKTSKN